MRNVVLFLLSLVLGLGAGLAIGWVVLPPTPAPSTLASLGTAEKDSVILLAATVFEADGNVQAARLRLAALGYAEPGPEIIESVKRGVPTQTLNLVDVQRLLRLANAFGAVPPELQNLVP
ncbi:MAG: hypothetical protein JNL09_07140 [Anaerolineales bacterium]|nr:hypothetical protein [Anaerolineales bacterium]